MKTWLANKLNNYPVNERFQLLPKHLKDLINMAESLEANKIWIFGSRARGDAVRTSDYDLAFEFEVSKQEDWNAFCNAVEANPPSLFKYDLVNFNKADKNLANKILTEGIIIYVRG